MNEHTPRRLRGTLVERAAAVFHFDYPDLPEQDAPPAPQPAPVAAPAAPAPEAIAPAPQPVVVPPPVPAPEPEAVVAPAPEPVVEAPVAAALAPEPVELATIAELEPVAAPAPEPVTVAPGMRRRATIDRSKLAEQGMLIPGAPVSVLAEEFRLVKRQLLLTARAVAGQDAGAADRARMILVCSAQPNEGKTFCAINLALSMAAESDVEILLVDADFAKPDVLGRLGIAAGPGLLDALTGAVANVEDCIIDTDVPHLSILPAGTKSASDTELLASDRAHAVLSGLTNANRRRIVIFDTPPVLAASPASVLALNAGQVMMVVRADKTNESELREAVGLLDGCEHIQLVLNSVSFQTGRRFGTYYEEVAK